MYRNILINGIEGLPCEYKSDATLLILKALKQEGGKIPTHSVSSLIDNITNHLVALHKLKSIGQDMPSASMRQLFGVWPTCFKWCHQIAGAILDDRSDCPPMESMLYFILLVIHMYAHVEWKGIAENPTTSKQMRRLAISLWLHSYDSTEAQHDATEVMIHNLTSSNICMVNDHNCVEMDDFRLSLVEVAMKMRLNEDTIMKMALKRLVRASQRAARFRSETFHTDYHLAALLVLINGQGPTAARFLKAFEEARGPLIVTNLLGNAIKGYPNWIFLDHFLIAGLTTLACSFKSSESMATMREILRLELFDVLINATLRLSMNASRTSPINSERWRLQRSLIRDMLHYRIAPLLLFRSTMDAMKNNLSIFRTPCLTSVEKSTSTPENACCFRSAICPAT